MIILKSFFRKKTTRIYLTIITALFLIIEFLCIGKEHYRIEGNANFEGSYFCLEAPLSVYDTLENIENVKKVTVGIRRNFVKSEHMFWEDVILYVNPTLHGREMLSWDGFATYNVEVNGSYIQTITDTLNIWNQGEPYTFDVKEIYQDTGADGNFISQEAFDALYDGKENVIYRIEFTDYFKKEKTHQEIEKKIDYDKSNDKGIRLQTESKKQIEFYELYVKLFTWLSIGFGIVLFFVLVNTIINIVEDEKKNSILLHYLGYSPKESAFIKVGKIFLLIAIPVVFSIIGLLLLWIFWF